MLTALCLFVGTFFVGVIVLFGIVIAAFATGNVEWTYRCTDSVMEGRKEWFGSAILPFEPLDGDPVGACPEAD